MSSNRAIEQNAATRARPGFKVRRLACCASLGCIGMVAVFVVPVLYFFVARYDVPFRWSGHYEKGIPSQRPFAISPDGNTIVFASTRTGHGDIYVMDTQGNGVHQLTSDPEFESDPAYSPDGKSIIFSRESGKCGHIWIMSATGAAPRQITFGSAYDEGPEFTPAADRVCFYRTPQGTSAGIYALYTMTPDGKDIRQLEMMSSSAQDAQRPAPRLEEAAFSPNNDRVYGTVINYTDASPWQIWSMDSHRTDRLAAGAHPAVSSDGARVAYVAGHHGNELWLMASDGSQQRRVYGSNGNKRYVLFSRDGASLYFAEETPHGMWISCVSTAGTNYRRLHQLSSY